jgi:hypothetical protein
MHHNTHEIMALCAALDADTRACWLAIGRRMLAKALPTKRPVVLNLLSFSGKPAKELFTDSVVGVEYCQVIDLFGEPVRR